MTPFTKRNISEIWGGIYAYDQSGYLDPFPDPGSPWLCIKDQMLE